MSDLSRAEHLHAATVLRRDTARTLDHLDGDRIEWLQAGAMEAQARALLATSHEAAISRIDGEQFRESLKHVCPSGWQLPAEALTTGRDLLEKVQDVRERFTDLWREGGSEFNFVLAEVEAFEAMAQFVNRLMNEIESRHLVERDPASS